MWKYRLSARERRGIPTSTRSREVDVQIHWTGLAVFIACCLVVWAATTTPDWMPIAEGVASVLILLALAGFLIPRLGRNRGL